MLSGKMMLSCQNLFFQRPRNPEKVIDLFTLHQSFSLRKGEKLVITGPSGSGKTTLLLLLAGFLRHQRGEIFYQGQDITSSFPQERPFSFLFQENNLFDHLTVLENMALAFQRRTPTSQQKQEIQNLLDLFQVGNLVDRHPHQLSGGERRRVSLARCLMLKRPILLLDEPFTGIDQETVHLMIQHLSQQKDLSLIFTSHHEFERQALATRVLPLHETP